MKLYLNYWENKNKYIWDRIWSGLFKITGSVALALLFGIFIFLTVNGWGIIGNIPLGEFLLGSSWNPDAYASPRWGILPLVLGTFFIGTVAFLIAIPLGLAIAVYLSEIAPKAVKEILKPAIEMIASIPSVVLGLLGLTFLAPIIAKLFHVSNGLNALTAGLLVAVTALPTIASVSEDALSSINNRFREASFALGATKWITIKKIVIPAARSGIIASIMLGFGRIIGETMIVLMVAGNSLALPRTVLDSARPLTSTIAIEIKEVVIGSLHWQALFAIGFVLFIVTFLINLVVDIYIQRKAL